MKNWILSRQFEKLAIGEVAMSIITYGELLYGAAKSHHSKEFERAPHLKVINWV